jgi:pimeloyl-ACP methyl ester carboxylesterase
MYTDWQENYVTVRGVRLHYHRTGGNKPSIVLAHGLTDNGLCWLHLAQFLESNYDLILYDARGHGLSDRTATYRLEDHVDDLIGLIDALELTSPFLLGHSMGGAHVPFAAVRYTGQLRGLLLEDPHWPAEPEHETSYDLVTWRTELALQKAESIETLLRTAKSKHPTWEDVGLQHWAEAKRQVDPEVVNWLYSFPHYNNWRQVVAQLKVPILLIMGDREVTVTPDLAEEAKQLSPAITSVHIANAGHSVRRDQFAAYAEAVKAFLDRTVLQP